MLVIKYAIKFRLRSSCTRWRQIDRKLYRPFRHPRLTSNNRTTTADKSCREPLVLKRMLTFRRRPKSCEFCVGILEDLTQVERVYREKNIMSVSFGYITAAVWCDETTSGSQLLLYASPNEEEYYYNIYVLRAIKLFLLLNIITYFIILTSAQYLQQECVDERSRF